MSVAEKFECNTKPVPTNQPATSSNLTEGLFSHAIQRRQMESFPCYSDHGIDAMVLGNREPASSATHAVQITGGSFTQGNRYNITKPAIDILKCIDIVAVLITHDFGKEDNVNDPDRGGGLQHLWFIIPSEVYLDKRMHKNYSLCTRSTWGVNVTEKFKSPLDAAYNQFRFFERSRESLRDPNFVDSFFPVD